MKQSDLSLNLTTKRTRKWEFLAQMKCVVPWAALVELVIPYAPEGKNDRPPFALEAMLRIHFMHVWTRRLLEAPLHDGQWSAYMYTACLVSSHVRMPAASMRSARSVLGSSVA